MWMKYQYAYHSIGKRISQLNNCEYFQLALLRKKKTIEGYEKALIHYLVGIAESKEVPDRTYTHFQTMIEDENVKVGKYIASLNELARILRKQDNEKSNDRCIYRPLEMKHRHPVKKSIREPIRLLHELLFLPHLRHYIKESYDINFKWQLDSYFDGKLVNTHQNDVNDFFTFEDCFKKPEEDSKNIGHAIGRYKQKYCRAFRDFPELKINVSTKFELIVQKQPGLSRAQIA